MDGQTDVQILPVFYRTSSPLGPLPKKRQTGGQKDKLQAGQTHAGKDRKTIRGTSKGQDIYAKRDTYDDCPT